MTEEQEKLLRDTAAPPFSPSLQAMAQVVLEQQRELDRLTASNTEEKLKRHPYGGPIEAGMEFYLLANDPQDRHNQVRVRALSVEQGDVYMKLLGGPVLIQRTRAATEYQTGQTTWINTGEFRTRVTGGPFFAADDIAQPGLIERLRALIPIGNITGNSDFGLINPDGPEAAALLERYRLLIEESLYHLRLDKRAKLYHEKALAALNQGAGQ